MKRLSSGYQIELTGDFDLNADYTVTVSPPLSSTSGYGLNDPFVKTLSFDGYNPEIWFPSQMFFQRSALVKGVLQCLGRSDIGKVIAHEQHPLGRRVVWLVGRVRTQRQQERKAQQESARQSVYRSHTCSVRA